MDTNDVLANEIKELEIFAARSHRLFSFPFKLFPRLLFPLGYPTTTTNAAQTGANKAQAAVGKGLSSFSPTPGDGFVLKICIPPPLLAPFKVA